MKLNRTREEWAKIKPDGRWYHQREKMALEDLAALFAQLEAERARVVDDALIASIHFVRVFIGDEEYSRQGAGSHMSDYHNEATEAAQHFEAIIAALGAQP